MNTTALRRAAADLNFDQTSDDAIGDLLTALATSKPNGRLLDLGTGVGLSLGHLLAGMNAGASVISLDNDPALVAVARQHFGNDPRAEILVCDGKAWINEYRGAPFDLIFADTWPGKFFVLDRTLSLVAPGGFYLIDDLRPQPNWPEGHHEKVTALIHYLKQRDDFRLVEMDWSTGLILMVKSEG